MSMFNCCKRVCKQNVWIIEFHHFFGSLYDEDGPISWQRELAVFIKIESELRLKYPLFRIKIVNISNEDEDIEEFKARLQLCIEIH